MTDQGTRFRLGIMATAIFGGSAIAGCCGGPFSADGEGGCTGDSPQACPPTGDGGSTRDAATDASCGDSGDAGPQ
jgi:hypothetical protein